MRFCRLSLHHEGVLGIGRLVVSLLRRCITFSKKCKLCSRWHWLRHRWNTYCYTSHRRSTTVSLETYPSYIFMGRYNHSLSLDTTIMVSKTAQPLMNTFLPFSWHNKIPLIAIVLLNYSYRGILIKNSTVKFLLYYQHLISVIRRIF